MSENPNLSQTWKTPDEVLKLHRFKLKKKALQARLVRKNEVSKIDEPNILEIICTQKRKNPFAKTCDQTDKKQKLDKDSINLSSEDSFFQLLNPTSSKLITDSEPKKKINLGLKPFDSKSFANIFNEAYSTEYVENEEQKCGHNLPIDWSLKSRMRILCETALPGTNLKTNQEASGITGFVRCVDRTNSTNNLDISLGARFHQCAHYWQHPHLPWLTLFPRNSKTNIGFQIGDRERESLAKDWSDSFRGLFQLLRARHCPYFYFCANTFTVLFRAAGIGGRVEPHALMSPSSRGMRSALKREEIEFSMPLKKESNLNRSKEENVSNCFEDKNNPKEHFGISDENNGDDDDDDEEEEKWLESLGVDEKEIKKISTSRIRENMHNEMAEDFSDNSILLIEGIECQAFFNFLLNAKSTITSVGRLAGIPPTLLAPVAFPKATMQSLMTRSSKVRNDGAEYFSIEMKGIILPNILPNVNTLMRESKDAFSITIAAHSNTLAFTKASQKLIEETEKENSKSDQVFGTENLSDCGLPVDIIEAMCNIKKDAVCIMERMCFSKEVGFIWS